VVALRNVLFITSRLLIAAHRAMAVSSSASVFFNPRATGGEERLRLDQERMAYWQAQGAQMSPRVVSLAKDAAKAPSTEA